MGSTFSELFYFYFQRVKKTKRKQGGGGIVVFAEFLKFFFYVNSFLCTVFLPSSLFNARFCFHLISSFWGFFLL